MTGMDPRGMSDNLYSYQDNLHWVWGKHSWQFGAWIQQYRLNTYGNNNGLLDSLTVPRYTVNNIAAGTISEIDQRFNIESPTSGYSSGSTAHSRLSANMLSGYFHDDWKLFRSLNISWGFRYDYLSPARENTGTAIVPSLPSFLANTVYDQTLAFGFASTHQALYARDFDNDSPYIGAAWTPFDTLPVVVRGGLNLSYIPDDLLPNMSIYALRNPFQSFNVTAIPAERGMPLARAGDPHAATSVHVESRNSVGFRAQLPSAAGNGLCRQRRFADAQRGVLEHRSGDAGSRISGGRALPGKSSERGAAFGGSQPGAVAAGVSGGVSESSIGAAERQPDHRFCTAAGRRTVREFQHGELPAGCARHLLD